MPRLVFEDPAVLWVGLVLPFLLFALGKWGWKTRTAFLEAFRLDFSLHKRKQVAKYLTAGILFIILFVGLALPKLPFPTEKVTARAGEILSMVDVSGSMAAQVDPGSPTRLDRAKAILTNLVDRMDLLGEVKISLHGFTSIARSLTPFVGQEDYAYLKESIREVLGIYATPGQGTSLGRSILNVVEKFPQETESKLIVLFSDGEIFIGAAPGMREVEREWIEEAIRQATQKGIRVITVGVGELEGARVPLHDREGNQVDAYAKVQGLDYYSSLEEECLKEIASRTGGQYFTQEEQSKLLDYIEENLKATGVTQAGEEILDYQVISHWFVLLALPFWFIFAKRYLL